MRFADGVVVKAHFDELALRRREVEDLLGEVEEDLRPYVIYRCQVGSKAFGLASEDSDDDLRGIYLPPARLQWSLRRLPEQLEFQDGERDEVYWELEKFLRLALKANPNVLETLWTPIVLHADETARELRELRRAMLSKHVHKTWASTRPRRRLNGNSTCPAPKSSWSATMWVSTCGCWFATTATSWSRSSRRSSCWGRRCSMSCGRSPAGASPGTTTTTTAASTVPSES